jgi:uncharacterized protein
MRRHPSRFRRLDGALADLPVEEPMLLTELDGFLTGVLLSPEPVLPVEWMQTIWGTEDSDVPPFDDPLDVQWFADAVMARHAEIARDLDRGRPQPILDVDGPTGEIVWESWIDGFAEAMALRPDGWIATPGDAPDRADALARLALLVAVARDESALDSVEINAFADRAVDEIAAVAVALYRARPADARPPTPALPPAKAGRNDPCPCGSGAKFKRCCGG